MNHIKPLLPDVLMVGGAAALSYGAGIIHPAAGYIVGGILALAFGVLSAINARRTEAAE